MKNLLVKLLLVFLVGLFLLPNFSFAQEPAPVYITAFYGDSCPHCHKELLFLQKLQQEFPNIQIKTFEIYNHPANAQLLSQVGQKLNVRISGVPFVVIGKETITGYLNEQTTGARIRRIVEQHSATGCFDIVGEILGQEPTGGEEECEEDKLSETITLPLLGEINIRSFSLPILTIIIGVLDGFNPCALWVLLFLVSLLLGMTDRKKMWILGGTFVATSAVVYFFFLAAWLNFFLFIGYVLWVRIFIGLFAITSGIYYLYEFYKNRSGCRATDDEKREKIMNGIRQAVGRKSFFLSLLGIIAVAFAVNLIELVCSAGLPAIYTHILTTSELSTTQYYLYLFLYLSAFIFLELIIFIVAMTTLQALGVSSKYRRVVNLIGGIVILILGILLIFKPGWIMFG